MVKLISKLDETSENSLYSGQSNRSNEMYIRPVPTHTEDGRELKASERYYVFRLLYFTGEDRNFPFIVRNEHEFYRKTADGKIVEVKRICCPSTLWARKKINDVIDKDYCPLCKFSFAQKTEGWKNFKSTGQIDSTCLQLGKDTERKWAAYLPVYVVSDPTYPKNNNHMRVLRLSGDEGKSAYKRILEKVKEAQERGITVFNGDEGANIALLCEKQTKLSFNKKNEPIIDQKTGKQKSFMSNCVTDVRLLDKKLHYYSSITAAELEKLHFDENYGTAASKDQLSVFLSENFMDNGASDSDFDDDEFSAESDDFEAPKIAKNTEQEICSNDDDNSQQSEIDENDTSFSADDIDDEDENPRDTIERLTNIKTVKNAVKEQTVELKSSLKIGESADELRGITQDCNVDDLPF